MHDAQTLFQLQAVFRIARSSVPQGEKAELLQNAIELVQQVALAGKNTTAGQVLQFAPQAATALKCHKLSVILITLNQLIEGGKERVLMVMPKACAKLIHCGTNVIFNCVGRKVCVIGHDFLKDLQAGIKGLPGRGCPVTIAKFTGETAQAMLVHPAITRLNTIEDQGFEFFFQGIGRFAAQQFSGIGVTPFSDSFCDLRAAQKLFEVGSDPFDEFVDILARLCGFVCRAGNLAARVREIRLAGLEPLQIGARQLQRVFAHRMVGASANFIRNGTAADMYFSEIDGVLPDLIDQLGLGHKPGNAADQDACRQAQAYGERAIHEFSQFLADQCDLGPQVLAAGHATVGRAAQACDQESQQVHRFMAAATAVQAP